MRGAFEETLRRVVPVRSVRLRDNAGRWSGRAEGPDAIESIALDVPGDEPAGCSRRHSSRARRSANGIVSCWASPRTLARSSWRSSAAGFSWRGPDCCRRPGRNARRRPADRIDARHAGAAGRRSIVWPEPTSRFSWRARAASARNWWRARFTSRAGAGTVRSSPSIAPRSWTRCSRRSSSASRSGPRPAFADGAESSSTPMEARCSSTRSPTCRSSAQAKLLRAIQDLPWSASAGTDRTASTSASSPPPIGAWPSWSSVASSGPTSSTAWAASTSACRRFASGATTSSSSLRSFLDRHRATRPLRLSAAADAALVEYSWPGNVRELERLIERAVALTESDIILSGRFAAGDPGRLCDGHHAVARAATKRCGRGAGGTPASCSSDARATSAKPARFLGISYHTLVAYLKDPLEVMASEPRSASWTEARKRG